MLKIKIEFELDEDQLRDIFESYNVKFTKKKVAELKKIIKEITDNNGVEFWADELQSDFDNLIGGIIGDNFEEQD